MKKTVKDINVNGKRVIVRCDFNVPLKDGQITDDIRITAAVPTIKYLVENGAKVIEVPEDMSVLKCIAKAMLNAGKTSDLPPYNYRTL